jgi:hypothetical protein
MDNSNPTEQTVEPTPLPQSPPKIIQPSEAFLQEVQAQAPPPMAPSYPVSPPIEVTVPVSPANNPLPVPPAPSVTPPLAAQPVYGNQSSSSFDPSKQTIKNATTIVTAKYLGIIIVALAIDSAINGLSKDISGIISIIVIVLAYRFASTLKKQASDDITESDKVKAIAIMAIAPIIAQAIFYYRLRKVHSYMAKTYNTLGWKIFGIDAIVGSILVGGLSIYLSARK